MKTTVRSQALGLELACDYSPVYSLATLCAGLLPVSAIQVLSKDRLPPSLSIEVVVSEIRFAVSLAANDALRPYKPVLDSNSELEKSLGDVVRPTHVYLTIRIGRELVGRLPVTVLPAWAWASDRESRVVASAYVLPRSEVINRIVSDASLMELSTSSTSALTATRILYEWMSDEYEIEYDAPAVEEDDWSGARFQAIRSPADLLGNEGQYRKRGNCLDLSFLLAGCLETIGFSPLIVFSGDVDRAPEHAFLACWGRRTERFRPILTDLSRIRGAADASEIFFIEATGICRARHRLSFDEAVIGATAYVRENRVHVVDVLACRQRLRGIRPLESPNDPIVQQALHLGDQLCRDRGGRHREVLQLLYGLCCAEGAVTPWLLGECGISEKAIPELIAKSMGQEEPTSGPPRSTRNYEVCWHDARLNAVHRRDPVVREIDLLWAVLTNPSRNIRRVLDAAGCSYRQLVETLDGCYARPGDASVSRYQASWPARRPLPEDSD